LDKPSLAEFLFNAVLNRRSLDMKDRTFKIISHPSKRKLDETKNRLATVCRKAGIFRRQLKKNRRLAANRR